MGLNYTFHFLSSFVSNQVAGGLLLRHIFVSRQKNGDHGGSVPIALSRDLLVMLFISQVQRIYWSFSPPAVWDVPYPLFSWGCFIETLTAPLVWLAVLYSMRKHTAAPGIETPWYLQWGSLTVGAFICACLWHKGMSKSFTDDEGFPIAIEVAMSSHILDGFAIIPQLYHLAQGYKKSEVDSSGEKVLSHFVALLSIGRVIRMFSWALHLQGLYSMGMLSWNIFTNEATQRVLLFMAPDLLHTLFMGDYMYLWFRALKQQTVDPWLEQMSMMV